VVLLSFALSCDRCTQRETPRLRTDLAAEAAVRAEARGFYRDLGARDTPALLDHFWPAKIAARWEPPFESPGPQRPALVSAAIVGTARGAAACVASDAAVASADLTIEGTWARALVRRCPDGDDELWLLQFQGRWKIVHLTLFGER
jgi:hypothetical protein